MIDYKQMQEQLGFTDADKAMWCEMWKAHYDNIEEGWQAKLMMHIAPIRATSVVPDIPAYQAMGVDKATGKAPIIEGRAQHRAYLKRNGYVELGNDAPREEKRVTKGDFNVRKELTEVARQVLPKYKR